MGRCRGQSLPARPYTYTETQPGKVHHCQVQLHTQNLTLLEPEIFLKDLGSPKLSSINYCLKYLLVPYTTPV